jgi:hypothetical protein
MNHSRVKSGARNLRFNEKALQCLELRKSGATWQQIAERGIYADKGAAYRAVMDLLDRQNVELGDELRTLMNARFDTALLAIWPAVQRGDLKAIDRMLRIEAQRARLYGIEAPVKTEITGADGGPIEVVELEQFVARLAALPPAGAVGAEVVELFPDREATP